MFIVIFLSLLAPASIVFGLVVQQSMTLTFLLFYGGVCLAIPIVDLRWIRMQPFQKILPILGFHNFKKSILCAFALGSFFLVIIILFFHFLQYQILHIEEIRATLAGWNYNRDCVAILLFLMIFANSILEELYWRGYIFSRFREKTNPKSVILLTALFYTSYHLITTFNLFSWVVGLIFSAVIFGVGLLWGYLRQKYDSIYIPMISHLMADLGIMLVYLRFIY